MIKSITLLSRVLLVVLCLGIGIFAQTTTGEISGTIKDPNGAVVPNATVTITGVDVGFNRTVQSNESGVFRANQVPPGRYKVHVAAVSGFAEQTKENVSVGINNLTTVDFEMGASVGAVVDVTGEGTLIDAT